MRITPTLTILALLALPGFGGCAAEDDLPATSAEETGGEGREFSGEESGENRLEETGGDDSFLDVIPSDDTLEDLDIDDDDPADQTEEDILAQPGETGETGETGTESGDGEELTPPEDDPVGTITITEVDTLFETGDSIDVSAGFHAPLVGEEPMETFGDCRVDLVDPSVETPPTPTLNAGQITVQGLLLPVFLNPETTIDGSLYQSSLPEDAQNLMGAPGSPISVYSNGGLDVPPFNGAIQTPTPVALISPATGADKSIDTGKPLVITWNPDAEATRIVLTLNVLDYAFEPVEGAVISCVLDGDPGSHVIPAEALQILPTKFLHKIVVSVTRVHEETVESTLLPITLIVTHTTAGIANAN